MKRRSFLLGATGVAVGMLARRASPAQSRLRLGVAYEQAGQLIASDFIGLSYESAILAAGDYFTPENGSTLGLIRALGDHGVIRIGGNMSERTIWNADTIPTGQRLSRSRQGISIGWPRLCACSAGSLSTD